MNLAAAFFIDIKKRFDFISKKQLFTCMIQFEVDGDLVTWMGFFLIDRKM